MQYAAGGHWSTNLETNISVYNITLFSLPSTPHPPANEKVQIKFSEHITENL